MRAFLAAVAAIIVAGCATAPAGEKVAVYDHKYNVTRYADRSQQSDFVGTSSASQTTGKAKPGWYVFGHP